MKQKLNNEGTDAVNREEAREKLHQLLFIGRHEPEAALIGDRIAKVCGFGSFGPTRVIGAVHHVVPMRSAVDTRAIRRRIHRAIDAPRLPESAYDGPDAVCSYGNPRCIQPKHLINALDLNAGVGAEERRERLKAERLRTIMQDRTAIPAPNPDPCQKAWQDLASVERRYQAWMTVELDTLQFEQLVRRQQFVDHQLIVSGPGDNPCWFCLSTNVYAFKRWLAEDMGIYPSWAHEDSPAYDDDRLALESKSLWVRNSCGYRRCVRPGCLVVTKARGPVL